jgi:hypothetical protein
MTLAVNIAQIGSNNTTFRNRIINGAMVIDQRNAGASVSVDGVEVYTLDRWKCIDGSDGVFSVQQDSSAPAGFNNSLKVTVTTADASIGATQYAIIRQVIEGFNFADFGFGTASAKTVTISFWVRSSLTGTFGGCLWNSNGGSPRCYPFTYSISSANTWEQKSVTIAGDQSGTWIGATSGASASVDFTLAMGSTYSGPAGAWTGSLYLSATGATQVISTNGATWYVTGVQLEAGSTASPFEYRSYGTEMQLCQRYFEKSSQQATAILTASDSNFLITNLYNNIGTGQYYATVTFVVTKRASPTVVLFPYTTPTNTTRWSNDSGTDYAANSATIPNSTKEWGFNVANTSGGTLTVGSQKLIIGGWYASAEL